MSKPWRLIAPADHVLADAVQLVLRARQLPVLRDECGPLPALFAPDADPVPLHDGAALLAALPDMPGTALPVLGAVQSAQARLAAIDPAAFPADLDLTIYALRQELRALEPLAPQTAPESAAGLIMAPLLWRVGLYDFHFGLFLLSGLPGLTALRAQQRVNPRIAGLLNAGGALRVLQRPGQLTGATAPPTDWSRALGPEGREKSLLPKAQRRKDPSIGSGGHIR
ncbi:hypothetical protein [Rhodobacter sp. 24-YEA-8]|uniref:hypothetical protein n=1 Tax=Rhodobacter sp. 24-YEA-8 TaxID=1884310 RepID=UPI000896C01A|nr:hypothetical protein [Rhodobacter sp. 24-YEA-8]SED21078.1 hypothetical protein SAMN05519105_3618 [Rhodobacter sp. 24-YEA-8]